MSARITEEEGPTKLTKRNREEEQNTQTPGEEEEEKR